MRDILITEKSKGYELLDSGDGEKLERFGDRVLRRPDPQAIWFKSLEEKDWQDKADAIFTRTGERGKWSKKEGIDDVWQTSFEDLVFNLKLLPSKHVGLFPEQSLNWRWLEDKIVSFSKDRKENIKVLNLFAHTGGATLSCARAGAEVCHVDASKFVVDAAHKNLDLSGLGDKKVRFIVDDVKKFVEREIKRGVKYDIVVMDPPVYGKGTKNEVWNLSEDLPNLISKINKILSKEPIAVVLNGYSSGFSHLAYAELLASLKKEFGGDVSSGELAIKDSFGKLLPSGIFARFEK